MGIIALNGGICQAQETPRFAVGKTERFYVLFPYSLTLVEVAVEVACVSLDCFKRVIAGKFFSMSSTL